MTSEPTAGTPPVPLATNVPGACVIALHNHGAAQRLLVAKPIAKPTPRSREVGFAESRKQRTYERGKTLRAEAKEKLQAKRRDATRAEHAGTVVSLFLERS